MVPLLCSLLLGQAALSSPTQCSRLEAVQGVRMKARAQQTMQGATKKKEGQAVIHRAFTNFTGLSVYVHRAVGEQEIRGL